MVALHIKELFEQLRIKLHRPMKALDDDYGERFGYSPATIRAWRDGKAKPQTIDVIEQLALDGMVKAKMTNVWLENFLRSMEASQLFDKIVSQIPPDRDSAPTSRRFPIGSAWGLIVDANGNPDLAIQDLGIETNRPTVIFLGGASNMSEMELNRVESWIADAFAPVWRTDPITILDGATDAGIVAKLGLVYRRTGAAFPLIGVVTHSVVKWPGKTRARNTDESLEPNHTHFLLTPGNRWEDASVWMARIGRAVAGHKRAVAVLVNGGLVAWKDAMCCLQIGIPVIAVKGSGRTADDLVETAQLGGQGTLISKSAVRVVDMNKPEELPVVVEQLFTERE